ncbi:MAG TPA: hypothetical protein VG298_06340 [Acidimicrobiales bacterium]|jgi:hypothetical protein|nr:hypothetical protein [Acidimicrobiales bacterium]
MTQQLELQYSGLALGLGLLLGLVAMARGRRRADKRGSDHGTRVVLDAADAPSTYDQSHEVELDPLLRLSVPTAPAEPSAAPTSETSPSDESRSAGSG